MTIDRLGHIDPVSRYLKSDKVSKTDKKDASDSIAFSDEGKIKAELYKAVETVRTAPDVRLDKVEAAKKLLQNPNYINDKLIDSVAERIINDVFDL